MKHSDYGDYSTSLVYILFSENMAEHVKTEMVFVKEECGGVDVKEELVEEQDPLSLEKGLSIL